MDPASSSLTCKRVPSPTLQQSCLSASLGARGSSKGHFHALEHVDDCSSSNTPSVQVPRAIHVQFAAQGAAANPHALTAGSLPACRSLFSIKHLWMSPGQTLGKDQSLHTCLYQPFLPAAGMLSGCADSRAPPVGPFLAARTSACAAAC